MANVHVDIPDLASLEALIETLDTTWNWHEEHGNIWADGTDAAYDALEAACRRGRERERETE